MNLIFSLARKLGNPVITCNSRSSQWCDLTLQVNQPPACHSWTACQSRPRHPRHASQSSHTPCFIALKNPFYHGFIWPTTTSAHIMRGYLANDNIIADEKGFTFQYFIQDLDSFSKTGEFSLSWFELYHWLHFLDQMVRLILHMIL